MTDERRAALADNAARCDLVALTREHIEAARTGSGGWTRRQLAWVGVPWPPRKGWAKARRGVLLPGKAVAAFIRLRGVRAEPAPVTDADVDRAVREWRAVANGQPG